MVLFIAFVFFFKICCSQANGYSVLSTELEVAQKSRAVRETSNNPILVLIQNVFGPILLGVKHIVDSFLDALVTNLHGFQNSPLLTLIDVILSQSVDTNLDSIIKSLVSLQTSINEVLSAVTGTKLVDG